MVLQATGGANFSIQQLRASSHTLTNDMKRTYDYQELNANSLDAMDALSGHKVKSGFDLNREYREQELSFSPRSS